MNELFFPSCCRSSAGRRRRLGPALALVLALPLFPPVAQSQTGPPEDEQRPQDELRLLREEIGRLQSAVNESRELINQLRQQQLDQYLELERRLLQADAGREASAATADPQAPTAGDEEEARDYRAAHSLVRQGQHAEALSAFREFLARWPRGERTADAWFWTGELHLNRKPAELEDARRAFAAVLARFPGHEREPNAMFKLGKVYHLQGKTEQAEQILRQLVETYRDASHSAARLAEGYLRQYF